MELGEAAPLAAAAGGMRGRGRLLPLDREWTVDDLSVLPADGLRYELIDGGLLVSRGPTPRQQVSVVRLAAALQANCPANLQVLVAPVEFRPDRWTSLQPDMLVLEHDAVGVRSVQLPPLLVIEVMSSDTRHRDRVFKRRVYRDHRVPSYWLFDPDRPSIVVLEWLNGHYVECGSATGAEDLRVEFPYTVRLRPVDFA
jgi:Uma2 family endonuclease